MIGLFQLGQGDKWRPEPDTEHKSLHWVLRPWWDRPGLNYCARKDAPHGVPGTMYLKAGFGAKPGDIPPGCPDDWVPATSVDIEACVREQERLDAGKKARARKRAAALKVETGDTEVRR